MNDLLTVAEVAQMLRVDDTTVRRWIKQGVLDAVVLPHIHERQGYRIKRETLEKGGYFPSICLLLCLCPSFPLDKMSSRVYY